MDADEVAALGKVFFGLDFSSLSRYEAGIERGLYKALHELQRLQAARRDQGAQLPVAIDVTGDSPERPRDESMASFGKNEKSFDRKSQVDVAHSAHNTSACSNTVCVAASCKSGG